MKAFLKDKGVDFIEKDVSIDQPAGEELFQKTGQMTVPTVIAAEFGGPGYAAGFDETRLRELLNVNQ